MRLAFSNAAFTHEGVKMLEVPVILNDDMSIVETPQRWLFNIALDRGRTRSPTTWRSYAEALYDWLQTCQANGWTWNEVDEGHLQAYRNQMLYHPSSVTGRAYSRRTINGRLRRLAMFYTWAFRRELIDKLPSSTRRSARRSRPMPGCLLAHLSTRDTLPALDLTVCEYRSIPTALSVDDLRRVRSHLDARDALIADWAVSTGARRMEVLGLTLADIPDSHAIGSAPFVPLQIIGKGGRKRALQVPLPIIDRTNRYIGERRNPVLRRRGIDPGPRLISGYPPMESQSAARA
jgi:integrase/recombinase XerD